MKHLVLEPILSLFFIAAVSISGCSTLSSSHKQSLNNEDLPYPVIDAHTHTYFTGEPDPESGIMDSKEEFLREMKEAGVVGAVSHAPPGKTDAPDLRSFGVVHCAGLVKKVNVRDLEDGLKSGRYGCIKIYLGYVYQWAYDKNYEPAYKLAEKYDVPVVFHTGDTDWVKGKLKYADPLTVDEVAVAHPRVRFVIAHSGNPWIRSAAEVAFKNSNVWLDGSAFLIGDYKKIPKEKIDKLVVEPLAWIFDYLQDPNKLMFGTDWPLVNLKQYLQAFKRAIPKEYWKQVFFENAAKVFKFKMKA